MPIATARMRAYIGRSQTGRQRQHGARTMTATTTQAQQIAEQFGDDGQRWYDADGRHLDEVCAEAGRQEWRDGYRTGDTYRYEFADGSAIVVAGDAWDIEGAEPFSWAGL